MGAHETRNMQAQLVLLAIYALTQACAAPVQFDCGAEWAQCGSSGHPSCCQGTCTCAGSGAYKQCTPAKGQWKCGSKPTPPPAPTPPTPPPTQPAKLIGYWSTTWAAVPAPKDANHAANWSAWTGAKGRFVPSVGCNALKKGGYANVTQYFRQLNITTTGYLVWPSSGCKL